MIVIVLAVSSESSTVTVLPTGMTTGLHWVGTIPESHVLVLDHGSTEAETSDVNVEQPTGSQRMCFWVVSSWVLLAPVRVPL